MAKSISSPNKIALPRFTYLGLLLSIIIFFIVAPFFSKGEYGRIALDLSLLSILAVSVYMCSNNKIYLAITIILASPTILRLFNFNPKIDEITLVFNCIFFAFVIYVLLQLLFTTTYVTKDVIYAALSVYFLLGIFGGIVFTLLEYLSPGSFALPQTLAESNFYTAHGQDMIYFSFVTLTTSGYGDIVPLSQPAKFFSILEAVTGQIYLTVMIARLIGMHISQLRA